MKERSLVAQRVVYDAVSHGVVIDKVDISTIMIHKVSGYHSKYKEPIEDHKKIRPAPHTAFRCTVLNFCAS